MTSLPIHLSHGFSPTVKMHDTVTVGQVIAQREVRNEEIINIPQELGITLKKARKSLYKNPGDAIAPGDVVAVRKGFLGLSEDRLESRVGGVVLRYERDSGNLVIRVLEQADQVNSLSQPLPLVDKAQSDFIREISETDGKIENIVSPLEGRVVLCNNEKIVIETDKDCFVGTAGTGEVAEGEFYILDKAKDESEVQLYQLDGDAIHKIVVGGKFSRDALVKGIGMGVLGIVATDVSEEDMTYLIDRKMTTPVIQVKKEDLLQLIEGDAKKAYINGHDKTILLLKL